MAGPFYFAWVDAGTAFNAVTHAVEDEEIVGLRISQDEGDFASLEIEVRNPDVGLLSAGRKLWCWLSWDDGGGAAPLFTGRLVAVPENLHQEVVTLLFVAQPEGYSETKAALAETLKALPFYDPVWVVSGDADADTVLLARSELWHIDRVTLAVTTSDIIAGEDGTIGIGEADIVYDSTEVTFGPAPLSSVTVRGTVAWDQQGTGSIDVSRMIWDASRAQHSIYTYPQSGIISSLTGDGLKSDWPKPGTSIGSGWTVGDGTVIEDADQLVTHYTVATQFVSQTAAAGEQTEAVKYFNYWHSWEVKFPVAALAQTTILDWEADRKRTETASFTMAADVQAVLSQPAGADAEVLDFNSEYVSEPVDPVVGSPGELSLPIIDIRRNAYFKTDRGVLSLQYMMLRARALLRARARTARVKFQCPWAAAVDVTCRHSVTVTDRRLPGGQATGKVASYALIAGDAGQYAEITIACTIGRGGSVSAAAGTPTYVENGYVQGGYQRMTGAEVSVIAGELVHQSLGDFAVVDDGLDLFHMTPETAVESLVLTGGLEDQVEAVLASIDPLATIKLFPTRYCIDLKPVSGLEFHTDYTPSVQDLPIPQTIDLEAA